MSNNRRLIAGLVAALAIVLQYLGNGIAWTSARIRTDMHKVIAAGLFFAIGTGLVSILLKYPFLTSAFTYLKWPVVGKFEVASAMVFDLGVFLVVVGAIDKARTAARIRELFGGMGRVAERTEALREPAAHLRTFGHLQDFTDGVLDARPLVLYGTGTLLCLGLAVLTVEGQE